MLKASNEEWEQAKKLVRVMRWVDRFCYVAAVWFGFLAIVLALTGSWVGTPILGALCIAVYLFARKEKVEIKLDFKEDQP